MHSFHNHPTIRDRISRREEHDEIPASGAGSFDREIKQVVPAAFVDAETDLPSYETVVMVHGAGYDEIPRYDTETAREVG